MEREPWYMGPIGDTIIVACGIGMGACMLWIGYGILTALCTI